MMLNFEANGANSTNGDVTLLLCHETFSLFS